MDMVVLELLQSKETIGTDIAMVFMAHLTGHMICHGLKNVANGMEKSVYQKEVKKLIYSKNPFSVSPFSADFTSVVC